MTQPVADIAGSPADCGARLALKAALRSSADPTPAAPWLAATIRGHGR